MRSLLRDAQTKAWPGAGRAATLAFAWAVLSALFASPVLADEAEDQYAVAAAHYARADWRLAVKEFETFLEKHPAHASAESSVFFLGEALLQLERHDEALKRFAEYLAKHPKGPRAKSARFRLAETAYLAGRWQQARESLEQFRQSHPNDELDAFVLPYLGETHLTLGRPSEAEKAFREALTRFPEGRMQDECRLGLAKAVQEAGRTDEARRLLSDLAAKRDSSSADEARFRLGMIELQSGDPAAALTALQPFERDLTTSPWYARASLTRAVALKKLERFDEAKAILDRLTAQPEVGVEARYWIGLIQIDRRQWDAAADTLVKLAQEQPEHKLAAAIHVHAGDALMRAGRANESRAQFDAVLAGLGPTGPALNGPASRNTAKKNPWHDDAMRGLIQLAVQTKDAATVDRLSARFFREQPESPLIDDVRRLLGRSLIERREFARAVAVLEPLCDPNVPRPLMTLNTQDVQSEKDVPSKHDSPKTSDQQPLEDRYLLAMALQGCDRPNEALALLGPVVKSARGPLRARARLAEASLLTATNQLGEAQSRLEEYLATTPEGPEAIHARTKLAVNLIREGRSKQAEKLYLQLLEHHAADPLLPPATEQLAEAAYDAGNFDWSAQLFARLVEQADDRVKNDPAAKNSDAKAALIRALSGLGWCQLKRGETAKAEATFERVLRNNPEPKLAAETAWARGRLLEQLDRADGALAMYDLILDRYAKSAERPKAMLAAARLRDRLQRDVEAAEGYGQFATDYPRDPRMDAVLYEWSGVLDELDMAEEAASLRRRLQREHPESRYAADAAFRLAQREADAKDYPAAEKWTDQALAGRPAADLTPHILRLRWQIAAEQKQWDAVRRAAGRLIDEYPESPLRLAAEFWTAEADYRADRIDDAARRLEDLDRRRAGRDEPWLAMVPLRRAQILARQKKWQEALDLASTIQKEFPDFAQQHEVDYLLGRCLASQADFEAAREAYRRVIRGATGAKTETAAMAQWMIGETYFHQKDYETAVREYLRVEALYAYPRWQAGALLQAGKCLERLGQWDSAAELYGRVVNSYSNTAFAAEAAARLRDVLPKTRVQQAKRPEAGGGGRRTGGGRVVSG